MATLPLTRSKHVVPFATFLGSAGARVDRLLSKAGLPTNCVDDPETLIPSAAAFRFREFASRALGLPSIAVDATRRLQIANLGDFGRALMLAPTLCRLLTEFRDHINTQTTMAVIQIQERECGGVSFCHRFDHIPESGPWQSDLYILQWTIKLVRLVDPTWSPREIWSVSPTASGRREAIEQFGAETVAFGRQCTGFSIPSFMLGRPLTSDNVSGDAGPVVDSQTRAASLPQTYSDALRQMIKAYASDRWLSIEVAGEVLGSSVRTIQRRLNSERTSYSGVVDRTRAELAGELLETTDATIAGIAKHLGYRSQGNFTRAFRRWAGVSPRAYRGQRKSY